MNPLTIICNVGVHCQDCRDLEAGRAFRAALGRAFELPAGAPDFECQMGKEWGWTPPPPAPPVEARPAPTVKQASSYAQALFTGKYVTDEIRSEREAICQACDRLKIDPAGNVPWCGVCGCGVSNLERQIRNLAAYEERLPKWGCKHPLRQQGKGWKR